MTPDGASSVFPRFDQFVSEDPIQWFCENPAKEYGLTRVFVHVFNSGTGHCHASLSKLGEEMARTTRTLHQGRWQSIVEMVTRLCDSDKLPCLAIATGTENGIEGILHVGRPQPSHPAPLRDDAIFLVASITKPIVAMATLLLIERGQLTLVDRVVDFIPEFGCRGKYGIEIRHLLTHSSGLPDMLPDNIELRQNHASLERFVERTCEETVCFPPGRGVQYQSMGFAILGEVIARITGNSSAQFLRKEFFEPLEMRDTALGATDDWYEGITARMNRISRVVVPEASIGSDDWNWNSVYWQRLGAPWGGLLTSATDLAEFARMMLREGKTSYEETLLSPATISAATRNQLECMRDIPEVERRCRPWGLGWRLDWPAHSANFGDLLGPRTYGHWGATGTILWIDPDAGTFGIILTTMPQEQSGKSLSQISNAIAAAWI